jgi:hypothetical protein
VDLFLIQNFDKMKIIFLRKGNDMQIRPFSSFYQKNQNNPKPRQDKALFESRYGTFDVKKISNPMIEDEPITKKTQNIGVLDVLGCFFTYTVGSCLPKPKS